MDCCRDSDSSSLQITSLETSTAKLTPGVTTFENEATVVVDAITHQASTLMRPSPYVQDITRHFARPYAVLRGPIATGARSRLVSINFPNAAHAYTQYPSGALKMAFATGARYTIVFTLSVSASPFNHGLLCMAWQYGCQANQAIFDRTLASTTATNCPHVRLDIAEETTVQLRVPFLATKEYGPILDNDVLPYGFCSINTLTGVDYPTGTSAPTFTVYYHLEDMEIFGANPQITGSLVLQSGTPATSAEAKSSLNWEAIKASRAVSTILGAAGTVAGIASAVPTLTPIMGPASWFLSTASGVAATLGWSKPQIPDSIPRMNPVQTIAENNVDLPSSTVVVGPLSTNRLGFDKSTTITNVDEMAFDFVKAQMSQLTIALFQNTDPQGTALFHAALSPAFMWFRVKTVPPQVTRLPPAVGTSTVKSFQPTSIMNLASYFKYWRGGFRFRVTFVKTKFHAGRVQFVVAYSNNTFVEADMGTAKTVPFATFSSAGPICQGFNILFNLKESNVCEFVVPYVSPIPYNQFFNPIGLLSCYIVDPLKTSAGVSTSVPMLVEVAGADDFEVADYTGPWWPHVGAPSSNDPFTSAGLLTAASSVPEGGSSNTVIPSLDDLTFQSGSDIVESLTPPMIVQNTIGEKICSFKQLIMIPFSSTVTSGTISAASRISRLLQPWYWYPGYPSIPSSWSAGTFSVSGQIASCYAFTRGGTDAHIYAQTPNSGAPFPVSFNVRQIQSPSTLVTPTFTAKDGTASTLPIVFAGNSGVLHLRLPAYQGVVRYISGMLSFINDWGAGRANLGDSIPFNNGFPTSLYEVVASFMTYSSLRINTNAADDAYCHTYMGPIPFGLLPAPSPLVYDFDSVKQALPAPA